MRDIIFRGKRADNGEWVVGSLIIVEDAHRIATSCLQGDDENLLNTVCAYKVIPETVGQYTGLTDKNGTDIFEGDIVKGSWGTKVVVYYDDCYAQFRAREVTADRENDIDFYGLDKIEVVGNISDDPNFFERRCR